jgi:hypothetical protein
MIIHAVAYTAVNIIVTAVSSIVVSRGIIKRGEHDHKRGVKYCG